MYRLTQILIAYLVISLLTSCGDSNKLGGGYEIHYFGDDREIINKRRKFEIGPRIVFFEKIASVIIVIQREPELNVNLDKKNIVFGGCKYYLIDTKKNNEIRVESIQEIKKYMNKVVFRKLSKASDELCS